MNFETAKKYIRKNRVRPSFLGQKSEVDISLEVKGLNNQPLTLQLGLEIED